MEQLGIYEVAPEDFALCEFADTSKLEEDFGFRPDTPLREGLRRFARWYKEFYMS